MKSDRQNYLDKQRRFWTIDDPTELKFNRVDTLYDEDRTDEKFDAALDERVAWIVRDLYLPHDPAIVEIGCGIGAVIQKLLIAYPDAKIFGTDISGSMVEAAKAKIGPDPRVQLEVTDGDNIARIPDSSVDLVVCTGVFIHILDIGVIRDYIREAARVLKPGGALRFNARYWNPDFSFAGSFGGKLARFLYRIGWYSTLKPRNLNKIAAADFNGLYFTLSEIDTLTREAGFLPEEIFVSSGRESVSTGYVRANCRLTPV